MIILLLLCCKQQSETPSLESSECSEDELSTPPEIRRLTDVQYHNAVAQLLNIDTATPFPPSARNKHFHTFATNNTITASGAESVLLSAEQLIDLWNNPCSDASCAEQTLLKLAEQAYRRTLSFEEQEIYSKLFSLGLPQDEAMRLGLSIVLQSPQFLYIYPEPAEPVSEHVAETSALSRAAALSLFLLNKPADPLLIEKADNGALDSRILMREQASLLLEDPDFLTTLVLFHRDWLHLYRLDAQSRDADRFPLFEDHWFELMKQEQELFFTEIFWQGEADFSALLYSPYAWIAPDLRSIYNLPPSQEWERIDFSADESNIRLGILSRPAWITAHSYTASSSPVKRGAWVLEQLLCTDLAPPADVDMEIPPPEEGANTIRDRLNIHSSDPSCAACHDQIDPIGFSFEHYDPIGQWRDLWEDGTPVDSSASLSFGDFADAQELLAHLGNSPQAQSCYAEKWFSYALGRPLTSEDHCTLEPIVERFIASNGNIRGLIVDIATSDPFMYMPLEQP